MYTNFYVDTREILVYHTQIYDYNAFGRVRKLETERENSSEPTTWEEMISEAMQFIDLGSSMYLLGLEKLELSGEADVNKIKATISNSMNTLKGSHHIAIIKTFFDIILTSAFSASETNRLNTPLGIMAHIFTLQLLGLERATGLNLDTLLLNLLSETVQGKNQLPPEEIDAIMRKSGMREEIIQSSGNNMRANTSVQSSMVN